MDKKKIILIFVISIFVSRAFSQASYSYQPLTTQEQFEINNTLQRNAVNNFLINNAITLGPVSLTNISNMVSYNPIEGTRLRASVATNNNFSKRLGLYGMIAYGTTDNKFKYSLGAAYNFAKKATGIYSYPTSTLAIEYSHNTFMPTYSNYDVAYFSFSSWDRFYFARKDEVNVNFTQDIQKTMTIKPFVSYNNIYSYMLYENDRAEELLAPDKSIKDYAAGIQLSFVPMSVIKNNALNIINSRFYSFNTGINISYSYNYQEYIASNYYHRLALNAQHRFLFKPMALDLQVSAGKIFGESYEYMYFSPNYRLSNVSNMFGFNLYSPSEMRFREFVQLFAQYNFGGILLDYIPFVKAFRPNEFVNVKALFTADYTPYCEAGLGFDHIFGFIGVELIKRFSKENPFDMPEWAVKIRCTL